VKKFCCLVERSVLSRWRCDLAAARAHTSSKKRRVAVGPCSRCERRADTAGNENSLYYVLSRRQFGIGIFRMLLLKWDPLRVRSCWTAFFCAHQNRVGETLRGKFRARISVEALSRGFGLRTPRPPAAVQLVENGNSVANSVATRPVSFGG
jgi:hypothetical protein